ncbi:O-antigen ligase family protein [Cytobacillus sp. BC1816]|uniref:O-antigen ligase family protein n=1 Tax=Cytobacillus sp. BC1816 TaxID=3440154 RepID=UPI003F511DCB
MIENLLIRRSPHVLIVSLAAILIGVTSSINRINILLLLMVAFFAIFVLLLYTKVNVYLITLQGFLVLIAFENNVGILGIGIHHIYLLLIATLIVWSLISERIELSDNDSKVLIYIVLNYMVLSSVGIVFSQETSLIQGFVQAVQTVILPTAIVLYLFITIKTHKNFLITIKILVLSSTLVSLIGIIQYYSSGMLLSGLITNYKYLGFLNTMQLYVNTAEIQHIRAYVPGTQEFRAHGSFFSHNIFAAYVGSIAPLTIIFFKKNWRNIFFYSLILFIQTLSVYLTFSRGGLLTLIFAYLLVFFIYNKQSKILGIAIKVTGVAFIIIPLFTLYIFYNPEILNLRIFNLDISNIKEMSDRFVLWDITIKVSKENLLFGSGTDFLPQNLTSFLIFDNVAPHNMFFHILYTYGLISLLLTFFLLIWVCIKTFKIVFGNNCAESLTIICIFSSIVSFVGSGITESLFVSLNLKILFWILISLFFIFNKISIEKRSVS